MPEPRPEEVNTRAPGAGQRHLAEHVLPVVLGWSILLVALCLGLSWFLVHTLTLYGESIERGAIIATASAAAASFDANEVKNLKGSSEEQTSSSFLRVRQQLQHVRAAIHDSRFSYLMASRDGRIIFLADAEDPRSPDYSPPGQVYDEATDVLRGVFVTKKPSVEGPVKDRWGNWVSGFAPIIDRSGHVVAVFGFDINAKNWNATIARFRWIAISISAFVAATIVLFGLFGFRQHRLAAKIRYSARHDALTGLVNRRAFVERLQEIISERGDKGVAVVFIDLDHFKDVNDTLGHSVGDELLRAVAERLRQDVRRTDWVGRFGGDEFALIVEAASVAAEAEKLANRLISSIREPFEILGNQIRTEASVGIAISHSKDDDAERLLSYADIALYQAKNEERGTYKLFTEVMDMAVRARVTMNAKLRRSLDSEQLFLEYQPQVEIETRRITGVEALVRWRHPERGVLQAAEFIPGAEQSGLLVAIDRWVLREACRQGKAWLDAGIAPPRVAVNISALHFKRALELERDILDALADTGLPPALLELELTESGVMAASYEHEDVLSQLRSKGIRLAIDDFGTGYSSLDYLRRYPADRVKIAKTFIDSVASDPDSALIVKAITALSRQLGMVAIAEGIETLEQLEVVQSCLCREAQGFYFSRPLGANDIFSLLKAGMIYERFEDASTMTKSTSRAAHLAIVGR